MLHLFFFTSSYYTINMTYLGILFDLDGTLLDTIEDIKSAMNKVLAKHGFPLHSAQDYRNMVGWGLRELVRLALPRQYASDEKVRQCVEEMKIHYAENPVEKTKPYPGINRMLDLLFRENIKLGILSNKIDGIVKQVIASVFPERGFHSVRGLMEEIPRKPDPAGALLAAEEMGVHPEKILYIGDSDVDMKTAKAAGMFPAGVDWGYRSSGILRNHGAEVVFSDPMEIPEYIRK